MPHRKQEAQANPEFQTLDDLKPGGPAKAGAAQICQPGNCLVGDRMGKWHDYPNAECPRCGFATISLRLAQERRPGFDFKAKGLTDIS